MKGSCAAFRLVAFLVVSALASVSSPEAARAAPCVAPDNGSGTATLPPALPTADCATGYQGPSDVFHIIDGLPPGTTVDIQGELTSIACGVGSVCSFAVTPGVDCDEAGGSLAGEKECADAVLQANLVGTGSLAGYGRSLALPLSVEIHAAPRTPGEAVQGFDTDMFRMFGQIVGGDPDFDLLRITAGTDFGLPSPGHTTLSQDPGGWWIDSFFDITYRIDFVGAPGGPLAGMSGSTTGTIRLQLGEPAQPFDHLECFKAKDPQRLQGVVDLPTLAGTPYDAAGCKIGKANKFCTPARKTVVSASVPVTAMPGPNLTSDYVCYPIKCPRVSLEQGIKDQFGERTLGRMKQGELCVPATRTP